jgi:hypothetical protein
VKVRVVRGDDARLKFTFPPGGLDAISAVRFGAVTRQGVMITAPGMIDTNTSQVIIELTASQTRVAGAYKYDLELSDLFGRVYTPILTGFDGLTIVEDVSK